MGKKKKRFWSAVDVQYGTEGPALSMTKVLLYVLTGKWQ